jgi:hypothetical protein
VRKGYSPFWDGINIAITTMASNPPTPKVRDLRLDFFRGVALLLIFIGHIPDNWLSLYRPEAFSLSDAADIFVFVSGYAVALAIAPIFRRTGFIAGAARVVKRCSEIYAGHLGLFFTVAMFSVAANRVLNTGVDYIGLLNLNYFFEQTKEALLGLFTMTYVPNYFDILPMYMVALAMLPPLMLLARLHWMMVGVVSLALYLAVPIFKLNLPAEIAFERPWFFNPFAWQFLFYTGFILGSGWIKRPPMKKVLVVSCAAFLVLSIPISHYPTYSRVGWLNTVRMCLEPLVSKTNLGVLRYLHFLCLAYLAVVLLSGREKVLSVKAAAPVIKAGQQSLPVFLSGMALSYLAGMALDVWERTALKVLVVNGVGVCVLVFIGYVVAWFKSQPWRVKPVMLTGETLKSPGVKMEYVLRPNRQTREERMMGPHFE